MSTHVNGTPAMSGSVLCVVPGCEGAWSHRTFS